MKKITVFVLIATMLTLIVACVKDLKKEGIYPETEITGIVVEKSTNAPLSDVKVKITDGDHIHAIVITGANGAFCLKMNTNEINDSYFLLLDGSPNLPSKQEELRGIGSEIYNYNYIVLYDKTDTNLLPHVTTGMVSNIMTTTATVSGAVSSNGGNSLTERGICYATHQSPTVDDMRSTAGAELGTFSCNLTGLQTNVTYYVRAYATNTIGTAYGAQKSFIPDGLPSVTTTTPTHSGTAVTAGGNVTSDGGSTVTARGVCYGRTPYPDLTSAHSHTTNGSGTGSFSATFEMSTAGVYYVRAYATNANGTSYGEQMTVNHPYNDLPTFTFGGRTFRVAPASTNTYKWSYANAYCNDLTLYGYTDWRMPSKDEMYAMWQSRSSIGGFGYGYWWSSVQCSESGHYTVRFSSSSSYNGGIYCLSNSDTYFIRPIRVED